MVLSVNKMRFMNRKYFSIKINKFIYLVFTLLFFVFGIYAQNKEIKVACVGNSIDNHPHSLIDPTSIVDSVLEHQPEYLQKHHINLRGNLNNSRYIFENEK